MRGRFKHIRLLAGQRNEGFWQPNALRPAFKVSSLVIKLEVSD